jgi:hypothetical protein
VADDGRDARPGGPGGSPAPGDLGLTPTPDTGERLSPVTRWDEATRPTSPGPTADAVYTDRGRAIGAHLIEIHDHLREELARIRDLIRQVREGAADAGSARSAISEMTSRVAGGGLTLRLPQIRA